MQEFYDKVLALREKVLLEGGERAKVQMSDEYLDTDKMISAYQSLIADCQKHQAELLATVPDSTQELEDAKAALMEAMMQSGIEAYDKARFTYREKNRVNVGRVLEVVGGDIGTFLELAGITQKTVRDFAKQAPEIKKELLGCIETIEREVTGLTLLDPES